MPKGSQLAQLKSALSEAGASRQSQTKSSSKKRKWSGDSSQEKEKAAKKLREIHQRLNPFDVKVTKLKHDVGGRKIKGVTGRPGLSKQAGIEQRKKTLLVEYEQRGHAGGLLDRRFGENDPTMAPEERMLQRFTREMQRVSKGVAFNLEDDDLTHYGQSLSAMEDFDAVGLGSDDDDEGDGQIEGRTVSKTHFGGFEDDEISEDEDPARRKSKAEVMAEVIAKSKEHKYQRQMDKEQDENTRYQLDQEFDSIRGLLFEEAKAATTGSNSVPLGRPRPPAAEEDRIDGQVDQSYDQFVRELAFEKRAKPKDRTKTEEELALEEKEALERAEESRLQRMMGIEDDSGENEDVGRKSRKRKRERGGDDLEDDFIEGITTGGLGAGLGSEQPQESSEGGTEISADEQESSINFDDENDAADKIQSLALSRKTSNERRPVKQPELPFTFPCPMSHHELLSILDNVDDEGVITVIQRIRSLHHPSLSKDNPAKLQAFTAALIDHILHVTSPPTPRFTLLDALLPHIYALTQAYPVASAKAFISKLSLMHKNLMRGLSHGATSPDSKTWPGTAELGLLRVIGVVWSTSDMNHAVVSPTRVLMGAYLGLGRIRSIADVASGLFLCTIFLQFEELSKRLIPEAIHFLLNVVLHLAPHPFKDLDSLPGCFPMPDFGNDTLSSLKINSKSAGSREISRPNLVSMLCGRDLHSAQAKIDLLDTALQLLHRFADIYKGLDGFVELYQPVVDVLQSLTVLDMPMALRKRQQNLQETLQRLLKFTRQSRCPLLLQAHKPIPIPSYVPKFSATSSNYLRKQDPDQERAAISKLRNQVKQERKGAIRELRKDARFLAGVQQRRQAADSQGYNDRMKKVFGSIEGERAEQKVLDRERAREKKRAGRK